MGKNIVIFSDGTGQRSGISFDERRSNIYKLYRACRCGPDSAIDPADQFAFYDPGVGTAPPGSGSGGELFAKLKNLICKATGWGLTTNLVDCYAAIIRVWRPGDRIYLFGFSRGAYTVRLLGGVLSHCGVPTKDGDDVLPRSEQAIRRIAKEGIIEVYQHTASVRLEVFYEKLRRAYSSKNAHRRYVRKTDMLKQREILAARFRARYGSEDLVIDDMAEGNIEGRSNVVPYFIGAFDTVSSLFHKGCMYALAVGFVILIGLLSFGLSALGVNACSYMPQNFQPQCLVENSGWGVFANFVTLSAISAFVVFMATVWSHFRFPGELQYGKDGRVFSRWETFTLYTRMVFGDRFLSSRVPYARHAIAVDEHRDLFDVVRWEHEGRHGGKNKTPDPTVRPDAENRSGATLREMCFAGCHTDIGGGYPEDESRLSDIALEWMAREARSVGLQVDKWYFQLWPDPLAIQHDEMSKWYNRLLYTPIFRSELEEVELHPSLEQRMRAARVLYFDREDEYRPESLRSHSLYADWLPKEQFHASVTPPPEPAPSG